MHTPKAPEKKTTTNEDGEEVPVEEEDPEALAKSLKPKLLDDIYPESVISLRASDQMLKRRAKLATTAKASGSDKWSAEKVARKLKRYNTENDIALFKKDQTDKSVQFPTIKFF